MKRYQVTTDIPRVLRKRGAKREWVRPGRGGPVVIRLLKRPGGGLSNRIAGGRQQ